MESKAKILFITLICPNTEDTIEIVPIRDPSDPGEDYYLEFECPSCGETHTSSYGDN